MLSGEKSSLARLITLAERESPDIAKITEMISSRLGKAYRVGITGPPGVGKSTLADKLTLILRKQGLEVGIIAVDPSSPLSGGAVLGDRIRMQQHYLDDGVFIRSMATRGSYGGLSRTVGTVIDLLDAFGKDIIIVETVGVGQMDTSIRELVDSVVLVLVPEFGNGIQLMKAGFLEIADIVVINKADRGGAEILANELRDELETNLQRKPKSVILAQGIHNIGIEELHHELEKRRQWLKPPQSVNSREEVAVPGERDEPGEKTRI